MRKRKRRLSPGDFLDVVLGDVDFEVEEVVLEIHLLLPLRYSWSEGENNGMSDGP